MKRIGRGQVTSGSECRGTVRMVQSVEDVLRLLKSDLSEVILLTDSASATTVTPLFAKIKGVICTSGGATSHLAIVAREFDLPCIMGSELNYNGPLEGKVLAFTPQGEILLDTQ